MVVPPRADFWSPSASREALALRADVLASIRSFFAQRGVLEVETPLLSSTSGTDVHLAPFRCPIPGGQDRFLQTSPELAMKRLLAAGSGPIYQICKAFRAGEAGRLHNPEFTMLEWYRPSFSPAALMDEIDDLLSELGRPMPAERISYRDFFEDRVGIDPHSSPTSEVRRLAIESVGEVDGIGLEERHTWLDLLFSQLSRELGKERPVFLFDFPASQAALARVRPGPPPVAERFELFIDGIELANGYHELLDAQEQKSRFEADLAERRRRGLPELPRDERFLAALEAGMPACSGVALGLDRLLLVLSGQTSLTEVVAFPWERT